MGRRIRVRVKGGLLEPLEKLELPDGKELTLSIDELPERSAADEAFERAAGAWKGMVDADALIKMLYEARLGPGRGVGT
jgi:predicted DNA-binding antitoxin AbrB/MazE fold protein